MIAKNDCPREIITIKEIKHYIPCRTSSSNKEELTFAVKTEKLSSNYPQIRIDLYNIEGHIYVGEFTIFHFGGLTPFVPDSYDEYFGQFIKLPI